MQEIDISIVDNRGGSGGDTPVAPVLALNGLVTAQQPSGLSNLSYTHQVANNDLAAKAQVAHQDALNRLHQSILAGAVNRVQDVGPAAARAAVATLSGNSAAQELADLKSALAAFADRQRRARAR